jgi:hypothetical protein
MYEIPLGKTTTTVLHIKSTENVIRGKYIRMPVTARNMFAIFNIFQGNLKFTAAQNKCFYWNAYVSKYYLFGRSILTQHKEFNIAYSYTLHNYQNQPDIKTHLFT